MLTLDYMGNLGNHMWQYSVLRTIAEHKGYLFGTPISKWLKRVFDFQDSMFGDFQQVKYEYFEPRDGLPYDKNLWNVQENTKLHGYFESENYIINNKKAILEWFAIEPACSSVKKMIEFDDNTCIVNFRGSDFKSLARYIKPDFYFNSINFLRSLNQCIKFVVITEDVEEARLVFSNFDKKIEIYHFDAKTDFQLINGAKYNIIANSTFS